jgi:hypothetical protein
MMVEFSPNEVLFLRRLCSMEHGHCSQDFLRSQLEEQGIEADEFKTIKKKLLYAGYIGVVYGNITIENKDWELDSK